VRVPVAPSRLVKYVGGYVVSAHHVVVANYVVAAYNVVRV
jgi:hypothetical protein